MRNISQEPIGNMVSKKEVMNISGLGKYMEYRLILMKVYLWYFDLMSP